jgi:hypothetical protein
MGIAYGILTKSVATLNGNGLSGPVQAAFDGERILGHKPLQPRHGQAGAILTEPEYACSIRLWNVATVSKSGSEELIGFNKKRPFQLETRLRSRIASIVEVACF